MRSIYISRKVYNRNVYLAFKKAYNTLHRPGNSIQEHHQRIYNETGCRVKSRYVDEQGRFRSATIEFERDEEFTMFMLKWA